jgi:hypothetical protein
LLYRAQPQDLRGVMLTAPIGQTSVTLRPFMVSGFNDEDALQGRPSVGLMAEYRPSDQWSFGLTNWFSPGLKTTLDGEAEDEENEEYGLRSASPGGEYSKSSYESSAYQNSVFERTNTWSLPSFKSAHKGTLYFMDIHATWKPRPDWTFSAEYLLACSTTGGGNVFWDGISVLANYDIDDRWRVFGQWSYLDDPDGAVTGDSQREQEVNLGTAYRINRHIELRAEYRRDFSNKSPDVDSVSAHLSIGY